MTRSSRTLRRAAALVWASTFLFSAGLHAQPVSVGAPAASAWSSVLGGYFRSPGFTTRVGPEDDSTLGAISRINMSRHRGEIAFRPLLRAFSNMGVTPQVFLGSDPKAQGELLDKAIKTASDDLRVSADALLERAASGEERDLKALTADLSRVSDVSWLFLDQERHERVNRTERSLNSRLGLARSEKARAQVAAIAREWSNGPVVPGVETARRKQDLLGQSWVDPALTPAPDLKESLDFYTNKSGRIRAIEYGTGGYSHVIGNRTFYTLGHPYKKGRRVVADVLVDGKVRTLPVSTLMSTDLGSFEKYWLTGKLGPKAVLVPSDQPNRFLVGVPEGVADGKALVDVNGRMHEFDTKRLYLANLYQPDDALATLRRLQKAGGDGYILRSDVILKTRGDGPFPTPARHVGELVMMTRAPHPYRLAGKLEESLFLLPETAGLLADMRARGVAVLFGKYNGVYGMYMPSGNKTAERLMRRFRELRGARNGVLVLSDRMSLSTLVHEREHALDRIDLYPKFVVSVLRLGLHQEVPSRALAALWSYITEQRAYSAEDPHDSVMESRDNASAVAEYRDGALKNFEKAGPQVRAKVAFLLRKYLSRAVDRQEYHVPRL